MRKKRRYRLVQNEQKIIVSDTLTKEEKKLSPKKNVWKRLLFSLVFLSLFLILFFSLTTLPSNTFSAVLTPNNNVKFKIAHTNGKSTSPLCGCLDDSMPHSGLLLTGNDITIERISKTPLTNYFISAPFTDFSYPSQGYTFRGHIETYVDTPDIVFPKIEQIRNRKLYSKSKISSVFDPAPFLSIITSSEVHCHSYGFQNTISYIPTEGQDCTVKVNSDNYQHILKNITIENKYSGIDPDNPDASQASLDILGDSIAYIWRGTPKILFRYGLVKFLDTFPPNNNYINVLIVKSPFVSRISPASWSDNFEEIWRSKFTSQFNNVDAGWWYGDVPMFAVKDSKIVRIKPLNLIDAEPPIYIFPDSGSIKITIETILNKNEHKAVYDYYTKAQGVDYLFDPSDYAMIIPEMIDTSDKNFETVRHLHHQATSSGTDAQKILKYTREMRNLIKIKDTGQLQKISFKNLRMNFRYPPLTPLNAIGFFNSYSYLALNGTKGSIEVDEKQNILDENKNVEFVDLHGCSYNKPSIQMGIDEPAEFNFKGNGKVYVDSKRFGRRFGDTFPITLGLSLLSLTLSFITLLPLFKKIKDGSDMS